MIVTGQGLDQVLANFGTPGHYGLDTETTGLTEDDQIFSLILSDENDSYYFDFNNGPEPLNRELVFRRLNQEVFANSESVWFIHNAPFDLRMLAREGCELAGRVQCSYATERLLKNNYFGKNAYKLSGLAARRGMSKDESVDAYIKENKLYTEKPMPGKKKISQLLHFDKVPFEVMSKYGLKDGYLHRAVGLAQLKELDAACNLRDAPSLRPLYENEVRLTKTLFRMGRRGVTIDRERVQKALEFELDEVRGATQRFLQVAGTPFTDSNVALAKVFDRMGESYPKTDKGNPSFKADFLEELDTPLAKAINTIRYHERRAGTYYSSFLHFADTKNVIHAEANQAGTETGRMSYRDPNLQNVPKEDETEDQAIPYHVRESFIPRSGHFFTSIDFEQMEYKVMIDYAGEQKIIKQILDGADFHQAIADQCGITRKQAKTLNFAILYGAGITKIAKMLGVSLAQAKELKATYFGRLPRVQQLIRDITRAGEARGFVFNWLGRRCYIAQRDWAYVLPNHLIQGGCADIVKIAMNKVDDFQINRESTTAMLLQVHDELLIETREGDESSIPKIRELMESVYKPQNGMRLTTSVEHSSKSWGYRDKVKGLPGGKSHTA